MLLFAYGSHACPYGDWSKEEKLTYVGGLFSCSLQVNFSSFLSTPFGPNRPHCGRSLEALLRQYKQRMLESSAVF